MNKDIKSIKMPEEKETWFSKIWYKTPLGHSLDGWCDWDKETREKYPIQYFVRESVVDACYWIRSKYTSIKYYFRYLFKPAHPIIRKALPRQWNDISGLIVDVNLAMIEQFKKEADESWIDWEHEEHIKQFKNWLDSAAHWVKEGRPNCVAQMEASYPPYPLPEHMKEYTYDQLYGNVNHMQKLIDETDTNIIKQMIDYREYFWT